MQKIHFCDYKCLNAKIQFVLLLNSILLQFSIASYQIAYLISKR
jgi:hypothetical protein